MCDAPKRHRPAHKKRYQVNHVNNITFVKMMTDTAYTVVSGDLL